MPGRSGFLLSNVVPQQGISYDLTRFSYVGSAGSAANALWLHRRTGITSLAELRRAKKEIVIGALNARSENAIAPRVLASYEGWPLKVVTGYPGFNEVLIALERGEVDGLFSHEGSVANSRPDLIASGAVKADRADRSTSFPACRCWPTWSPIRMRGRCSASSPRRARSACRCSVRPAFRSERLEILRASYLRLMDDQEYRAEADKRGLPVGPRARPAPSCTS